MEKDPKYWTMIFQLLRIHSVGQSPVTSGHMVLNPIFFHHLESSST